ncbi:RGP1 protein [Histoplasma capsulatum G186AR]|uniref:RGP1 protein n=2 Tax=Ajellomyces capsulatus TaxID=5037 RepID=C0ND05_AJECG|nr:RGP1 protein [Histoplasma capsulatum G186AR]EEH11546.1 RGP1 protein [Histoplasma capsulatum G186AR]KAG5302615.1 RGP1 protein [Histoplasma capsulatum]QSS71985.1 RGP1 protein [Histoplasma capsulatum G186AR]
MQSDIQVFVRWKEQTIFAGEDVECTITFKNVSPSGSSSDLSAASQKHARRGSRPMNGVVNGGNYSPAKSLNPFSFNNRRSATSSPRNRQSGFDRSHRSAASMSSPLSLSHSFPPITANRNGIQIPGHKHKRSVSIISLEPEKQGSPTVNQRMGRAHSRSASFQVFSKKNELYGENPNPASRPLNYSPARNDSIPNLPLPSRRSFPDRTQLSTHPQSEIPNQIQQDSGRPPPALRTDFKFPQAPPTPSDTLSSKNTSPVSITPPTLNTKDVPTLELPTRLTPAMKILSASSMNGSTRSSGEFYSLSNNSTETLESEYVTYTNKPQLPIRHRRHHSNMEPVGKLGKNNSQTLLMGYAQISASFTVDGSLINQALFEEVKRKGVVGNPARGDVSRKTEKARNGFWGTLGGWNNLSDSLSTLLSSNELDGLRDMRGVASSQAIPLLSTPQSLLFVDLRLDPGEEKSFSFAFTLPRGLPASHKGKAIKVSYNLVIGTQRAINPKEPQKVHRINVPFRVLSGVDAQGGVLGHDLMRPYVLLRDEARVQKLDKVPARATKEKSISAKSWTSAPEFLSYVDEILDRCVRRESITTSTLSTDNRLGLFYPTGQFSCKDAIELAILRSNQSSTSDRSANRFEITRNGRRIAVIILNRPAHRLGETIIATIDFSGSALPCYSLRGSLETTEKVSPTIALRSSASITRATRKMHARCFENTLFATRVAFTPSIPVSATPTIITSGVNLEWELRFEFVTSSILDDDGFGPSGINLLETVERDDRGMVLASLESISCESFEVVIPLTVYGGSVQEPAGEELQGVSI